MIKFILFHTPYPPTPSVYVYNWWKFVLSALWVIEIELGLSGLAAKTFTSWAISLALQVTLRQGLSLALQYILR